MSASGIAWIGGRAVQLYALLMGVILLYPTIQLFIVAVSDDIVFPPRYFSLEPFGTMSSRFIATLPFSAALGAATTLILLVLCLPTAYAMQRTRFAGQSAVGAMIFLPFVIPGVGYAVALGAAYILVAPDLLGSFVGVLIPVAIANVAWMTRAIQGSLATTDPAYEDAALMLGASRLHAFRAITLPQIAPGIAVGSMIVFANACTAFIAPLFLGRTTAVTSMVQIFTELDRHGLTPRIAAQALVVQVVVMGLVLAGYLITRRRFRGFLI